MDIVGISKTFLHLFNTYEISALSFIFYIFSKEEKSFKPLIALLFLTMLYNSVLKEIFKCPLPEAYKDYGYSFPSGHTNFYSIFYFWLILTVKNKGLKIALFSILALTGTAIVVAGFHHLKDVAITPLFAASFIWLYKYLESKLENEDMELLVVALGFLLVIANYLMVGNLQYHISLAYQIILGIYITLVKSKKIGYITCTLGFLMLQLTRSDILMEFKFLYIALLVAALRYFVSKKRLTFRSKQD